MKLMELNKERSYYLKDKNINTVFKMNNILTSSKNWS
jgi:hypothetical protein